MITGHQDPDVIGAIERQLHVGVSYGAPTELEIEMAELLCARVPGLDMVRMCNSGTEATMSALRLARGATGRDFIIKRSEEHTSELQSLMRLSYAVFCLKKK